MPMYLISSNATGLRTREIRHAVQHAHTNGDLSRLRVGVSCPHAVTRERLEAVHRVLRERAPMVAAGVLSFASAGSGNRIDRIVAPRRARRVRGPMSGTFAWRNRGHCTARGDRGVARLGVVGSVTTSARSSCSCPCASSRRQKSRIYAGTRIVNRGTAPAVARKRQAAARPPD